MYLHQFHQIHRDIVILSLKINMFCKLFLNFHKYIHLNIFQL